MPREITVGGSGFQVGTSSGYQEINAGASGDILVLSNVDNKDVRLDSLTVKTADFEVNIKITVDGVELITGSLAGGATTNNIGSFIVSQTGGYHSGTSNSGSVGLISDVVGKVITVTKNTSPTVRAIAYSYSTGK